MLRHKDAKNPDFGGVNRSIIISSMLSVSEIPPSQLNFPAPQNTPAPNNIRYEYHRCMFRTVPPLRPLALMFDDIMKGLLKKAQYKRTSTTQ